ncbi:hypothetical protein ACOSQ3_004618 [Xanthoceras sorbifolium]
MRSSDLRCEETTDRWTFGARIDLERLASLDDTEGTVATMLLTPMDDGLSPQGCNVPYPTSICPDDILRKVISFRDRARVKCILKDA